MPYAARRVAPLLVTLLALGTVVFAAGAAADPDVDSESAAAVIQELQEQGYLVQVNGSPAGDISLLTTCTVTSIHDPGEPAPDPTTTTSIYVDVACPLSHA